MKSLKLYLFATYVLLCNPGLFANTDSLKWALNASKTAEDRFEISYAIARKTIFSEPDTAFKYLFNALQDSVQNMNSSNLAKCLNGLGVYYFNKSQFDSTIYFSGKALNIFLQNNDTANTISPRKNLALANRGLGNYNQALSEFFKILDYYKKEKNILKIAGSLNDIGNTYSYLKDYKEAINYQNEALRYLYETPNATLEGNVYNSIGYNFQNLGQPDSAIVYYEKSLVFKLKSGNVYSIVNTRNNLCALIDYKQFPEKREDCLKDLLLEQRSIGDKQGLARTFMNLSVQYRFYNNCDMAINYLDSTGYYLRFSNDIFLKQHYFDLYSKTLFQCGDYESAYIYKDSLTQLNDSVFSFQKRKELLELDTRYLTQQKNDSILMLETANSIVQLQVQKQKWQMFFLILLIVAVIGGGVFLVLYLKQRQEKLRDLALVKMREAERVRIARDMHDEVGSGLTRISLISEQLKIQQGSDAELKNEKVSKIIKQSRLLSRNLKEIIWAVDPSNDKMSELMFYLRDYIYEFSSNTSIECKIDFQDDILDFEVASEVRRNLFLALKEILNNVAKHANAKVVSVKFDMENNLGFLQVKDNGIGFAAMNVKKGVGLGSIKSRAEKLEGDFFIESKTGEGTSIYLKNLVLNTTKM